MKVLLVNGSSRQNGCTNAALCQVERALQEEGIETEMFLSGTRRCRTVSPAESAGKPAAAFSMTR